MMTFCRITVVTENLVAFGVSIHTQPAIKCATCPTLFTMLTAIPMNVIEA